MNVKQIAEICHEANTAYCRMNGDYSVVSWALTPDIIKQSVIAGVEHKLLFPDATPEQMHNSWLDYKGKQGYVYGTVKDLEKKTHPCFLPYEQLTEFDKVKDYIFTGIVQSLSKFVV